MLAADNTKVCSRCGKEKPVGGEDGEFGKNRSQADGWEHYCLSCSREYQRARRAQRAPTPPQQGGRKRCVRCAKEKPIKSFGPNRTMADGRDFYCIPCRRVVNNEANKTPKAKARFRRWEDSHRPQIRARRKVWRQRGGPAVKRSDEQSHAWRRERQEWYSEYLRQWRLDHPKAGRDNAHLRRAAKMGLGSERVDLDEVVRLAEGLCRLCGHPVDMRLSGRHPMGPTQEHLIPRNHFANEGMPGLWHTMGNVALAHRFCNSIKSQRPLTPELEAEIQTRMGLLLMRAEALRVALARNPSPDSLAISKR